MKKKERERVCTYIYDYQVLHSIQLIENLTFQYKNGNLLVLSSHYVIERVK